MSSVGAAKQEVWRLFVAIDLPDEVKRRLESISQTLRRSGWKARWTKAETMHLTLRFFGNQPLETVPALSNGLRTATQGQAAFELRATGMGAFPNPRRPRVIWLGVEDRSGALNRIVRSIEEQSRTLGIQPEERPFSPHLTIARIRPEDRDTMTDVQRHFDELDQLAPIRFAVDHATLYRSELRRSGAIYSVIERFDFEASQ